MKILASIAAAGVLAVVPAHAAPSVGDTVHQTSVHHEGRSVAVQYEPKARTVLRQSGLGPRGVERCLWKTDLGVERQIADAGGRPIATLTRSVGEGRTFEGVQAGYCSQMRGHQVAAFGGNRDKLRAFVAQAADRDGHALRAELASLGSLGHGASR